MARSATHSVAVSAPAPPARRHPIPRPPDDTPHPRAKRLRRAAPGGAHNAQKWTICIRPYRPAAQLSSANSRRSEIVQANYNVPSRHTTQPLGVLIESVVAARIVVDDVTCQLQDGLHFPAIIASNMTQSSLPTHLAGALAWRSRVASAFFAGCLQAGGGHLLLPGLVDRSDHRVPRPLRLLHPGCGGLFFPRGGRGAVLPGGHHPVVSGVKVPDPLQPRVRPVLQLLRARVPGPDKMPSHVSLIGNSE